MVYTRDSEFMAVECEVHKYCGMCILSCWLNSLERTAKFRLSLNLQMSNQLWKFCSQVFNAYWCIIFCRLNWTCNAAAVEAHGWSVLFLLVHWHWYGETASNTCLRMFFSRTTGLKWRKESPFPQIDIIGAMVIVWRIRGKIIRSVLCNIVCNNCAQCSAHTWTDLTVLLIGFCLTGPISLYLD